MQFSLFFRVIKKSTIWLAVKSFGCKTSIVMTKTMKWCKPFTFPSSWEEIEINEFFIISLRLALHHAGLTYIDHAMIDNILYFFPVSSSVAHIIGVEKNYHKWCFRWFTLWERVYSTGCTVNFLNNPLINKSKKISLFVVYKYFVFFQIFPKYGRFTKISSCLQRQRQNERKEMHQLWRH